MTLPSDDLTSTGNSNLAPWLKDLLAFLIIYLLIVVFFRELVFGGKEFLKSGDGIAAGIFGQWGEEILRRGIFPLWNPYIFSGMPSFGSLQFNPATYPVDWIRPVFTFLFWGGNTTRIMFHHLLGGIFTYLMLRDLDLTRQISLFGAIIFFFSPQEIVLGPVSHGGKLFTITYLPLLLLLTRRYLNRPNLLITSLLALVMAIQLLALHMQIAYYGMMMIGLYCVIDAFQNRRERDVKGHLVRFGGLVGVGILALALSAYLLWPVYEYSQYSIRGGGAVGGGVSYEYATNWSFHPLEALTFLVPSWFGFGGSSYWGYMPFTDHPYYMGLVPLLLAFVTLIIKRKNRFVQVLALIGVLSLLVSFGKWLPVLFGVLFKILPFFAKFRVPAMILILLVLAVAVLAAMGLNELLKLEGDSKVRWCRFLRLAAITSGVLFLVVLVGKSAFQASYESAAAVKIGPAAASEAYGLFWNDLLRATAITALAALSLHLALRNRLSAMAAVAVVGLLVTVDLWIVNARLVETVPVEVEFESITSNPHADFLKEQPGPFRILNIGLGVPRNYWMSQRLEEVGGYSPAKLRLYQQLLERHQSGQMLSANLLAMLNTRYIVTPSQLPEESTTRVFTDGGVHIYELKLAHGPAWLVGDVTRVQSDEVAVNALLQGFDGSRSALTTEMIEPVDSEAAAEGKVTLLERDIHKLRYNVEATGPVLLVLSEIFYPAGWSATVDGTPVPIHQVNHLLRAVRVEPTAAAGGRFVELTFSPVSVNGGRLLSMVTLPVILLLAGIGIWRRKRTSDVEEVTGDK